MAANRGFLLTSMLERFQAEIGKRILKLPRSHNNLSVRVGLKWPSFTVTILLGKLVFLAKLLADTPNSDTSSHRIFHTLAAKGDIYDISLVQQCKELELLFGTNYLDQCLAAPDEATHIVRDAKQHLIDADWSRTISLTATHTSLSHVSCPTLVNKWTSLWDKALDYGTVGTKISQSVFRLLCRPVYGDRTCPHCLNTIPEGDTFLQHLVSAHDVGYNTILTSLNTDMATPFEPPKFELINTLFIYFV